MQSMTVLLFAGLFSSVACQQYLESYGRFPLPGEDPLLSVTPHRSPASSAFDPTADEIHYAPKFREFYNFVPTNFINIDRRFAYPASFYYESTIYMAERPKHSLDSFPTPPVYQQHNSYNYPPQVYEPGGDSPNPLPSNFQPLSHSEPTNRGEDRAPKLYPGSYSPSFRDHQFPQVYEPPSLATTYRTNHLSTVRPIPSTSPNIIRDDETSTRGNIFRTNELDGQYRCFHHTPIFYNRQNTTEQPQHTFTTVSPPITSIGATTFPTSSSLVNRNFVPSLFNTRPSPPRGTPVIFIPSDIPSIIKEEITPSTTPYPSTNPGYDVSEPQVSTYFPNSGAYGQPINQFIPSSSTEPSTSSANVTLEGLFTTRMFNPSSFQMAHPGYPPKFHSRQPHVVFEAPGHDKPR